MNMQQIRRQALSAWTTRGKAHAAGLVIAGMMVASVMSAAPAQAATTFTVNSIADAPDASTATSACDTDPLATGDQCTLRAAIQQANANGNPSGVDTINFAIPGTGVKTISPGSELPFVEEPTNINGYSQPGSSVNTLARGTNAKLLIQISGTNTSGRGLTVTASNSVVKGLVINRFNGGIPLEISPSDAPLLLTNVRVAGNFIGTDPSGTLDRGNKTGIDLFATSDSTIGGASLASRNLISGNCYAGVYIDSGTPLGWGGSANNEVRGNLIGTQRDGIKPLGNDLYGVGVNGEGANGNSILSNSIFANGDLGIDLEDDGPTANDSGDTDAGANDQQNRPSLGSAKTVSGKTTIKGTLSSSPRATYTIQFFSNPSGTNQGRTYIGQSTDLAVEGSGKGSFTFSPSSKVAIGQTITATATNENTGDTSEFSWTRTVASS